jgi:MtN3 and saliva related transmembrane protein
MAARYFDSTKKADHNVIEGRDTGRVRGCQTDGGSGAGIYPEDEVGINLDLLGYVAAVLTTGAFVPQAITAMRTRDTRSTSFWMYLTFTTGVALWFVYGVVLSSWPMILANAVTFLLAATILGLKVRYG